MTKLYEDLKNAIEEAMAMQPRYHHLCSHVPKCPACGHEQVQLLMRHTPPAEWRCRICKHRFTYEPE